MKILDLCEFPLDSLSLIEASAGTGKTYAVANLYLRYLLEKKLSVEQILVVTFTEAATQELRDRVRARIQELYRVFEGDQTNDEVLNHLLANSKDVEADKLRLKIAERQIDQSEIHTIHGFCQQLLARHALELNVPLSQSLVQDPKPILLRVCEDFWRREVLTLPRDLLLEVYEQWSTPESLMLSLQPLINRRPEVCSPPIREGGLDVWKVSYQDTLDWFMVLRAQTLKAVTEVQSVLEKSNLKGLNFKLKWFSAIRAWCEDDALSFEFPKASKRKNLFEVFTPGVLEGETKKGAVPPEHPYFHFLEGHLQNTPPPLKEVFLVQSFQAIQQAFGIEKLAQSALSFDDLILSVSNALRDEATQKVLISAVRERFSAALIDEFQDTDREQYHIFSSIFTAQQEGIEDASMALIGDPKQAIYAFRGGDIATYLKAKKEISNHPRGHLFTMDTNWRSSTSMVEAVNRLFEEKERPFIAEDIPFYPVRAAKQTPDHLLAKPAFNIAFVRQEGRKKEALASILADNAVREITHLLESPNVRFNDIAILVRSGSEAELIKTKLSQYGFGASYEGKSNIYDSDEAQSIYMLLAAMAEPNDEYLIKCCLSDLFFGIEDSTFREIKEEDLVLDHYLEVFSDLHACWLRHGVLAAIRLALAKLGVYRSWRNEGMALVNWERRLSNVNQLAELLQRQSEKLRGHFALLRWLRQNISVSALADDESRLRLESDEQLISIVTIHKSKGLEYPYVFLPFLFTGRGADMSWFYDQSGKLNLDLLKDEQKQSLVERERLAEDIRLLYVALTRAKYQCFVGTFFYKGAGALSLGVAKTAWAYLLSGDSVQQNWDEEAYQAALADLVERSKGTIDLHLIDESELESQLAARAGTVVGEIQGEHITTPHALIKQSEANQTASCALMDGGLSSSWRVQSFTGLMNESNSQQNLNHRPRELPGSGNEEQSAGPEDSGLSIFDFPRGSKAGTFLHTLFENIDFQTAEPLASVDHQGEPLSLQEMIREKLSLSRLVDEEDLLPWSEYLSTWLRSVLAINLRDGFSLAQLSKDSMQAEMEFYYRVKRCQARHFNSLVETYMGGLQKLEFTSFEGHLKGAIDLVFEQGGRYYLLDYKSNYLGDSIEDYQHQHLSQAMDDHRYDLQYLIYAVALHRFLKRRLGERYSYESSFGGVYYLFLRGIPCHDQEEYAQSDLRVDDSNSQPGVYFVKPEASLIESLDRHMEGV